MAAGNKKYQPNQDSPKSQAPQSPCRNSLESSCTFACGIFRLADHRQKAASWRQTVGAGGKKTDSRFFPLQIKSATVVAWRSRTSVRPRLGDPEQQASLESLRRRCRAHWTESGRASGGDKQTNPMMTLGRPVCMPRHQKTKATPRSPSITPHGHANGGRKIKANRGHKHKRRAPLFFAHTTRARE